MKALEVLGLGIIVIVLAVMSLGAMSNPAAFAKLIQSPAPQLSEDPYSVQGAPSVSAQFIDQILCTYHSPACGTGADLYNDGQQYGIDPVVPLAFFLEESSFGKAGEAAYTHSLGNLRPVPGEAFERDGYAGFDSWSDGYQAWYELISNLYIKQWHLTTVPAILQRYAPTGDGNAPDQYSQVVKSAVSLWRSGKVVLP
jgi:hypothetical protein